MHFVEQHGDALLHHEDGGKELGTTPSRGCLKRSNFVARVAFDYLSGTFMMKYLMEERGMLTLPVRRGQIVGPIRWVHS